MIIVAFDPGETIGFASIYWDEDAANEEFHIKWDMKPFDQLFDFNWNYYIWKDPGCAVIYEQAFSMSQYVNKVVYEAIGGIKTMANMNNLTLTAQRPDVGRFIKARLFDGNEPRIAIHAREALYHVMFYLHTKKVLSPETIERIVLACQEYTSPTGARSNAVDASGYIKVSST